MSCVLITPELKELLEALRAWPDVDVDALRERPEWEIFTNAKGRSIYRTSFSTIFRRAADQIGLEKGKGFHELRHHYASLLISSGCSVTVVQRRLDHATAQETLDTYSHLWPDDDEKTVKAVDSAWEPVLVEYLLNQAVVKPSWKAETPW